MAGLAVAPDPNLIVLPYRPRVWAKRLHASYCRWAALVLHRRAGKTTAIMNHHQRAALSDEWEMKRLRLLLPDASEATLQPLLARRNYWHVMPTYKQAKQVSWIMMKDYARPVKGVKFNESELKVSYPNGNIVQLIGGDDPDSLRGPALSGLSLDEFSQIPRESFSEVLSKALADHLGYCIFSGTIKGTDQLYQTYQAAKDDATWFSLWQNVDVSLATEEGPTLLAIARAMEDDRKLIQQGLMLQEEYDQEWFLSAEAAIKGAWFKKEMAAATTEGRITAVPYEPLLPVDTYWDLGIADAMSIWFAQTSKAGQVRLIDFYEATGEGFPHFIKMLREKPYVYGKHWAPHDIAVRELGTGKSRLETAEKLGLKFQTAPDLPFDDGIAAARLLLSKCWFDAAKCSVGVTSLRNYRKAFNTRLNEFTGTPVHDTFCVTGDTEVLTRNGTHQIQYLPSEGEVLTQCGWKPYENPRITRRAAPLVAVAFSDGLTVRCTPEHLFLTDSGWKLARDLRKGSLIQSCWTHSPSTSTVASIDSGLANGIGQKPGRGFIAQYGAWPLDLYRLNATSIMSMAIHQTIGSTISNAYQQPSICPVNGIGTKRDSLSISRSGHAKRLLDGTSLRLAVSGIAEWLGEKKAGLSAKGWKASASIAVERSCSWFAQIIHRSIAPKRARLLRIESVTALDGTEDVWCLTVPDGHAWPLANGAIVHNSHAADAFRYLAVSHKPPTDPRARGPRPVLSRGSDAWMS